MVSPIYEAVHSTPFVDTHEHLIDERRRLSGSLDHTIFLCNDYAFLFRSYVRDDLLSAGMSAGALKQFLSPGLNASVKYDLVAPYWPMIKHSGYALALRKTMRILYGENDLTAASAPRIAERYHDLVKEGFYSEVLRRAKIESVQINSLESVFVQTEQPTILKYDLGITELVRCSHDDIENFRKLTGQRPKTLDDWLAIADWCFDTYGHQAVAVKSWHAYFRALDHAPADRGAVEAGFVAHASQSRGVDPNSIRIIQDFVFRYCLGKAAEFNLPVKLHTGYYAGGFELLQLNRIRNNAGDLSAILAEFPETTFVLMHLGYPYQHEFAALAKFFPNCFVDMCWAWIINPNACVRFLKEFVTTAPINKLFSFGGDYVAAENIVGHAEIARQGIVQAFEELVAEGWISTDDAPFLIDQIMYRNANTVFLDS